MTYEKFDGDEQEVEETTYEENEEVQDELGDQEDDVQEDARLTQEQVNEIVEKRLARERRKQDKELAKKLGVPVEQAREYIDAGLSVSQASGLTPAQIRERIKQGQQGSGQQAQGQYQQQQQYQPQDDLKQEINDIKGILSDEREQKVRAQQEQEAKKEFGTLYDDNEDEIIEKAEDNGLSLLDAAAIVLRPKIREHVETQTRQKQQTKRKRKVEGGGDPPQKGEDIASKLTAKQMDVARKMRIPLEKYYKNLKELGEIE